MKTIKQLCADYSEDVKVKTDDVATQIVKEYIAQKENHK